MAFFDDDGLIPFFEKAHQIEDGILALCEKPLQHSWAMRKTFLQLTSPFNTKKRFLHIEGSSGYLALDRSILCQLIALFPFRQKPVSSLLFVFYAFVLYIVVSTSVSGVVFAPSDITAARPLEQSSQGIWLSGERSDQSSIDDLE